MKCWVIGGHGGNHLRIGEAPIAEPRQGEVRVEVAAVALNAQDLMVIDHGMRIDLRLPYGPATDIAGSVHAVGESVRRFQMHDHVITNFLPDSIDGQPGGSAEHPFYRTPGGYHPGVLAQQIFIDGEWLVAATLPLSDAEAATLPARALSARHRVNCNTQDPVAKVYRITPERRSRLGPDRRRKICPIDRGGRARRSRLCRWPSRRDRTARAYAALAPEGARNPGDRHRPRRAVEDLERAVDQIGLMPVVDRLDPLNALPDALDHLARGAFRQGRYENGDLNSRRFERGP